MWPRTLRQLALQLRSRRRWGEVKNTMAKSAFSVTQAQSFRTSKELRAWLARHHSRATCLLLRICKKGSGLESITYAEALDEALCFGWIDGQKLPLDAKSWVQRFTPRKPRSGWSKRNTAHVERLIQANQMTPAGLKEVEAAKADGRWAAAYDSPADATVPPEFTEELARNPKAKLFFSTLNRANLYAIAYRLQTAKLPETKAKRMKSIIEMLARGERFH
jgi:uncharacterized protein YdeI (YjbR/CyaY-like superfamily)